MTQSIGKNATDLETFINIATRIAPTVQGLAAAIDDSYYNVEPEVSALVEQAVRLLEQATEIQEYNESYDRENRYVRVACNSINKSFNRWR